MKGQWHDGWRIAGALAFAIALTHAGAARAPLPVGTTFTGAHAEHTWPLAELDPSLPRDWTGFDFLVLEFRASSSQRFELGLETDGGRIAKRIAPFAGVWVRAAIPLRFYREPAGSAVDLAATYNQPRGSYWINIDSSRVGPTTDVRGLTVAMNYPVGTPTFELRAIGLARTDPGDAVLEGKPLVDEFGQYTRAEWPGKAHTLDDLKRAWDAEERGVAGRGIRPVPVRRVPPHDRQGHGVLPRRADRRPLVACLPRRSPVLLGRCQRRRDHRRHARAGPGGSLRGAAARGSHLAAARAGSRGGGPAGSFYTWNLVRRFGSEGWRAKWAQFTARRLASWGLNSIHYWGPRSLEEGAEPRVPYAQMLRGWQTADSIMGMPDVYAQDFAQRVEQTAASQLDARRDDPWMLGYFIGNEPPWPGRESQLVDAILAGPASEMQRRLKAHLAESDTPERRKAFVYEAFERYLEVVNAACRKHEPNHLNLGIRFGGGAHDELVTRAARRRRVQLQHLSLRAGARDARPSLRARRAADPHRRVPHRRAGARPRARSRAGDEPGGARRGVPLLSSNRPPRTRRSSARTGSSGSTSPSPAATTARTTTSASSMSPIGPTRSSSPPRRPPTRACSTCTAARRRPWRACRWRLPPARRFRRLNPRRRPQPARRVLPAPPRPRYRWRRTFPASEKCEHGSAFP